MTCLRLRFGLGSRRWLRADPARRGWREPLRPRAAVARLLLDAGDQPLPQHGGLPHGLGRAVLDAVDALAVAELAPVERGAPQGPLARPLGQVSGQVYKVSSRRQRPQVSQPTNGRLTLRSRVCSTCAPRRVVHSGWRTAQPNALLRLLRRLNSSPCMPCIRW